MTDRVQQARQDMRGPLVAGLKAVDRLIDQVGEASRAAVERHAEPRGPNGQAVITPLARKRILADIDKTLDMVFGAKRGAPSAMEEAIVAHAKEAGTAPIQRAVEEIERSIGEDAARAYRYPFGN